MSTIDAKNNVHDAAGQFAGKVGTKPAGRLASDGETLALAGTTLHGIRLTPLPEWPDGLAAPDVALRRVEDGELVLDLTTEGHTVHARSGALWFDTYPLGGPRGEAARAMDRFAFAARARVDEITAAAEDALVSPSLVELAAAAAGKSRQVWPAAHRAELARAAYAGAVNRYLEAKTDLHRGAAIAIAATVREKVSDAEVLVLHEREDDPSDTGYYLEEIKLADGTVIESRDELFDDVEELCWDLLQDLPTDEPVDDEAAVPGLGASQWIGRDGRIEFDIAAGLG